MEARRSCQENPCYKEHSHDALSIGAIDTGAARLSGPFEGRLRLAQGDVVVIPEGQVHACNPYGGAWQYQMLHIDQLWAASTMQSNTVDELFDGIRVLRCPALYRQVNELNDAVFADEAADELSHRLQALLSGLSMTSTVHLVPSKTDSIMLSRLAPVLNRLRSDATNPALDELASSVGMSRYQLIRAMRRATGLSPLAWRQNIRIAQARRMLRNGRSIAETAHELGFTDQSHFHRVFRAYVSATPGDYRR
ncbi:helix-turn-helix transcriptional regulator [Glutamicibacter endophyticus]